MLIYDLSSEGRIARAQFERRDGGPLDLPAEHIRKGAIGLPGVSELQAVRHFTNLSKKNFSIDGQFYPLGSCTMKYNPRGAHKAASIPGFLARHPLAPEAQSQGFLACLYDLCRNISRT
jgi:glycine dehydrogenase subunit 2